MTRPERRRPAESDGALAALAALAVVAALALAFWPGLGGGFVWDDEMLISGNPAALGLSTESLAWMLGSFHSGHYQPLLWLSYGLDAELWGLEPFGYHLTSLVIHALASLVALLLARRLFAAADCGLPGWAALAAALLFALHPLRVEAVSWVAGRLDSLAALFLFSSVWAYLRAGDAGARRARWLALSGAAFAASLASKASGMGLPLVLLALDAWPLRRFADPAGRARALRAAVLEKLPYAALALAGATVAFVARSRHGVLAVAEYGPLPRVMQAASALVEYPLRTLVPARLSPLYELRIDADPLSARALACLAVVLAVTWLAFAWRRRRPALAVAWVAYVVLVAPVSGLVQSGVQAGADRYTYVPTLALILLAVGALLSRRDARTRRTLAATLALALVLLTALTRAQTRIWRDDVTLWSHALRLDPESAAAHYNLGLAHARAGRAAAALEEFSAAIRHDPRHETAHGMRANVHAALGDLDSALADLDEQVRLSPADPKGWGNRASIRQHRGDHTGALEDFEHALALAPDETQVRVKRAGSLLALGRVSEARADLERALAQTPEDDPRHADLVELLAGLRGSESEPP